jgi:hypothetical protein
MLNDRICEDEAIRLIPDTLQIADQVSSFCEAVSKVREALRNVCWQCLTIGGINHTNPLLILLKKGVEACKVTAKGHATTRTQNRPVKMAATGIQTGSIKRDSTVHASHLCVASNFPKQTCMKGISGWHVSDLA